jgi:hypothetical protein
LLPRAGVSDAHTSVTLFDQGLSQVMQAAVAGLQPKRPYVLGLADRPDGSGAIDVLSRFMTNPAGAAIVNAVGQIRQAVAAADPGSAPNDRRRYLVIAPEMDGKIGVPVQTQAL